MDNPKETKGVKDKASKEAQALVFRNLPYNLSHQDLHTTLSTQNLGHTRLSLQRDAQGRFRGTAVAEFPSNAAMKEARNALGSTPEMHGRNVRVDERRGSRKSRTSTDESKVQQALQAFLQGPSPEATMPKEWTPQMRKLAHALAQKYQLRHRTKLSTVDSESPERQVILSKPQFPHAMQGRASLAKGQVACGPAGPFPFGPFTQEEADELRREMPKLSADPFPVHRNTMNINAPEFKINREMPSMDFQKLGTLNLDSFTSLI